MKAKPNPSPLFFSVQAIERHYGGPEEGGWWYDAGEVLACWKLRRSEVRVVRVPVPTWRSATGYVYETHPRPAAERRLLRLAAQHGYEGERRTRNGGLGRFSVRGGADIEVRWTRYQPDHFPQERPHYE